MRSKVDGDRHRNGIQLRVEAEREVFLVRTFRLHHILALKLLFKEAEFDVVRHEAGIADRTDRIDRQTVLPGGILPRGQLKGRNDNGV